MSAPECHASNHIEIIGLWLSIIRLPKYHFGACQLDFGFLWLTSQRVVKVFCCAAKAPVVRQPLGSQRVAKAAVARLPTVEWYISA